MPKSESICPACEHANDSMARFCGACGGPMPALSQALERYRQALERHSADGRWSADELDDLQELRFEIGLGEADHRKMVEAMGFEAPKEIRDPGLELAVDRSTIAHFVAGSRCLLRLRLVNSSSRSAQQICVTCHLESGDPPPEAIEDAELDAGESHDLRLWWTPSKAGFEVIHLGIEALDAEQRILLEADELELRVGAPGSAHVQMVHIDQSSARVVDNSKASFAPAPSAGGLIGDGDWLSLALRPIVELKAARLASSSGNAPARIETPDQTVALSGFLCAGELADLYRGQIVSGRGEGEAVVVKIAAASGDNDLIAREARVLAKLASAPGPQLKHLPTLFGSFTTADRRRGVILSLLDGVSLESIKGRHPLGLPAEPATWILRRTLSALGFAHSRGIIHGNLDPAHVLVRASDHNIFVIDWCYAAIEPARTGDRFIAVNELFSPPEVAQRKSPIPASDICALGRVITWLLGGDPTARRSLDDLVDERLARFLDWMTRQSPMQRPQDAWALYHEVDSLRRHLFGKHRFKEVDLD